MIRRVLTVLALTFLLAGCSEQDRYAGHEWPEAAPALWKVTTPRGNQGWLFGTVHSLPDGVDWQSGAVDDAFAEADLLVVEITNLRDSDGAAAEFDQLGYTPGLPPLLSRVNEDEREEIAELLDVANASERDFHLMKTWAVAMVLSSRVRSGDPENGVDRALLSRGKRNFALESFSTQYAIFDSLPDEEQADLLSSVAVESIEGDPTASVEAWLRGDMVALETLGAEGILGDPELREALLNQRNRAWIAKLEPLFEAGLEPFVAVGAGHMLGSEGLPELLAAKGWTVARVQ